MSSRYPAYIAGAFEHPTRLAPDKSVAQLHAECARGARYNDAAFGIEWPIEVRVIAEKDANWADYERPMSLAGASA